MRSRPSGVERLQVSHSAASRPPWLQQIHLSRRQAFGSMCAPESGPTDACKVCRRLSMPPQVPSHTFLAQIDTSLCEVGVTEPARLNPRCNPLPISTDRASVRFRDELKIQHVVSHELANKFKCLNDSVDQVISESLNASSVRRQFVVQPTPILSSVDRVEYRMKLQQQLKFSRLLCILPCLTGLLDWLRA